MVHLDGDSDPFRVSIYGMLLSSLQLLLLAINSLLETQYILAFASKANLFDLAVISISYAVTLTCAASLILPPRKWMRIACLMAYSSHMLLCLFFILATLHLGQASINYLPIFILDGVLLTGYIFGPNSFIAPLLPYTLEPVSQASSINF